MSAAPSTPIGRERLLWTAGIAIGASLPHWPQLPAWVLALLCACVAWRLVAAWIAWPLPPKAVQIVLAALAFAGVLMQYGTINGVGAGSALLVVMVALKFLELRGHRDQLVLMIVAYFLMFASLLYERSLLVAAYLLVFVWITTVGLLQLGRRGTLLPNRVTAKLSGRLLLHALPLMLVLFVLFPRLPGPLWGVPGSTSSGATGLSDTMSPGDITELGLSDAVAFRVEFLSRPPIPSELYWRGPVMTNYNGRTWSRQQGMRRVGRSIADTIDYRGEPTEYHVTLEPNGRPWAFALDMPQRWSSDRNLRMGSDYQLGFSFAGPVASRVDYEVTSYTAYEAREPLSASELKTFLSLPEGGNPRTRALVAEWTRDHPAVEQLIERAFNFFRSQPFFYTLTPPALGANPIDEFLFETREGFCEHYASAFAVMMRLAGFPTRVVTGYHGGELNNLGEYYIVRQSDTHAWTEIWLADRGWVRVDPIVAVAPERIALGSSRTSLSGSIVPGTAFGRIEWVRQALLAWDAANTYWNEWVLGYGPELQRALLEALGLERPHRVALAVLAAGATVVLLFALTLYLAWCYRHRRRPDPALRCFEAFGRRLDRLRVPPRVPCESPDAYARRARAVLPRAAADIERIVRAYLRARYEPDEEHRALDTLRRLVRDFRPARA